MPFDAVLIRTLGTEVNLVAAYQPAARNLTEAATTVEGWIVPISEEADPDREIVFDGPSAE